MKNPPLDHRYPVTVVVVLLALSPNIIVTTVIALIEPHLTGALHVSRSLLALSPALSNAGYAFGAVLAADLYARFDPRRLFVFCQLAFVAGAFCTAVAPDGAAFIVGRFVQGLSTGWMLVVAVPPLVNRYPPSKMPSTGATFLIGFFGAATAGPLIGGAVAESGLWREFFGLLALVGLLNTGLILLSVPAAEPPNPALRFDLLGVGLAAVATFASFVGVWVLETASPLSLLGWGLVGLGGCALLLLLIVEYRAEEALVPVKPLSTSLPVLGIVCAMLSGGVFIALLELVETMLSQGRGQGPLAVGLTFWPEVLAVAVAGLAFAGLFRTRFIPVLGLIGMVALAGGAVLVATLPFRAANEPGVLAVAGALGLGAGLTVSPSLVLAAFGVPSKQIGRTFALVELLRSSAAYLLGPVFLAFTLAAAQRAPAPERARAMLADVHLFAWLSAGLMALAIVGLVAAFVRMRIGLQRPDLEAWIGEGKAAMRSPEITAPA